MDFQFNSQAFAPQYGGGGFPEGNWKVIIVESGPKPVKDKPDHLMLALTLKCVEGAASGMQMADHLMMIFPSIPDIAEKANQKLSAYCHVTGVYAFTNTQQLHNIPFWVKVGPQTKNPQYTEIKELFDINLNPPGKSANAGQAPAPVQAAPPPPPPAEAAPAGFGGPAPAQGFPQGQPNAAPAGFGAPAAAPAGFGQPAPGGAAPWGPR